MGANLKLGGNQQLRLTILYRPRLHHSSLATTFNKGKFTVGFGQDDAQSSLAFLGSESYIVRIEGLGVDEEGFGDVHCSHGGVAVEGFWEWQVLFEACQLFRGRHEW